MNKKSIKKLNNAFALEYVVLLMAFVIVITAILLSYANLTVSATKSYKNYVLQKQFLDKNAYSFLEEGEVITEENKFSITFTQTNNTLIAKNNKKILLTVEVAEENGKRKLIKYVYGE